MSEYVHSVKGDHISNIQGLSAGVSQCSVLYFGCLSKYLALLFLRERVDKPSQAKIYEVPETLRQCIWQWGKWSVGPYGKKGCKGLEITPEM